MGQARASPKFRQDASEHPSPQMAEDEAHSVLSQDEGSSAEEETTPTATPTATGTAQQNGYGSGSGSGRDRQKRKRLKYLKTSCELCKARKVKCDRADPACSWCARHNRKCVYLERQRPGSRLVFSAELEARVNRIDALLQSLGRRVEEHIARHDGASPAQAPLPAVSSHHAASSASQPYRRDSAGTCDNISTRISGNNNSNNNSNNSSSSITNLMAPPPLLPPLDTLGAHPRSVLDNPYPSSSFSEARKGPTPLSAINDFPPHDMVYAIVDLYFKHCNPWCPILDRMTMFGTFFGSTSIDEPDRVLLHAIIATTLRFLDDPRLSHEMKAYHHAVSRRAVQTYALDNVSVASLRALVILSLDELGTSNGPQRWNMLSLLTQNVRQLGLCGESSVYLSIDPDSLPCDAHVDRVTAGRPDSWIEDEGRRRLCWMVYLLDRYTTIATPSLDFLLPDDKMRRALPSSYDLFSRDVPVETRSWLSRTHPYGLGGYAINRPENLGSFSYHCEILRIVSKVHDFLKAPLDVSSTADVSQWRNTYRSLNTALDGWLSSLPSDYSKISALCHSDPGSRVANWFVLHGAYVTAVVRLHSSAAYPTVRSQLFLPSYYAMQRCLSAVQSLADITRDVFEASGLDNLGPPFVFALWVAARLLLVHAAAVGGLVDHKVDFFIDILSHIGQYWEIAHHYSRVLARVVQRSRQGEMGFTAMRRNAHDMAALTLSTRQSSIDPTLTKAVSLSGLDNMDVFDFFDVPKARDGSSDHADAWPSQSGHRLDGMGRMPDPSDDWFRMPFV